MWRLHGHVMEVISPIKCPPTPDPRPIILTGPAEEEEKIIEPIGNGRRLVRGFMALE